MPAVTRIGDLSTGHPPFYSARLALAGSGKVFADGIAVNRVGDAWVPHGIPHGSPDTTLAGSPKMFADGVAVGRIGDPISCGDTIATGSSKTFSV